MSTVTTDALGQLQLAAQTAGLQLELLDAGTSFSGEPTSRFNMSVASVPGKQLLLELGQCVRCAGSTICG